MAHFEIKNLSFSYPTAKGKESLKEVSLTIQKGEYIVLCGKSGSGKTTLLRHLKPVLAPHGKHTGEILFNGIPMTRSSPTRSGTSWPLVWSLLAVTRKP